MSPDLSRTRRLKRVAKFRRSASLHAKYLFADEIFFQPSNQDILPSSESGSEKDVSVHSESPDVDNTDDHALGPFGQRQKISNTILFPMLIVLVPTSLLSIALLSLVFGRRVQNSHDTFSISTTSDTDWTHILVDYPATRLTFLASWLSTLAPFLSAAAMGIWSIFAARAHFRSSVASNRHEMFTAPSLSLQVGLLLASFVSLQKYYVSLLGCGRRLSSEKSSRLPHIVHSTAMILSLCALLVLAILVSETYLDVYTQTIPFERAELREDAASSYGKGLSTYCLDFSRIANFGLPCSHVIIEQTKANLLESQADLNEWYLLQHNISQISEIQFTSNRRLDDANLAILLPKLSHTPSNIDYQASTIGVSTHCRPMTAECGMHQFGKGGYYTGFNCSDNFWGVLGKSPNVSELTASYSKAEDSDVPAMCFKPTQNLQYGFFVDEALTQPYNSVGYDPETGSLTGAGALDPLPDNELINQVYMGVAGRFGTLSESIGSNLTNDPGVFHTNLTYVDFTLSCSYLTFEITYALINGTVTNVSSVPDKNGTLSEIYHGYQAPWVSPIDTSFLLQDDVLMAALQTTSAAMAQKWADLHSVQALSTIGGYTSPRLNHKEQIRTTLLVTKIPTVALAVMVAGSLSYAILATVLGIFAIRIWSKSPEVRSAAAYLSLDGLSAMAFRENDGVGGFDVLNKLPVDDTRREDHDHLNVPANSRDGSPFTFQRERRYTLR